MNDRVKEEKIGFIGFGNMGCPMARRLAERGFHIHAYDIRPERAGDAAQHGIVWMDSLEQIAETCGIIIILVYSGEQVRTIMCGAGGLLEKVPPGTIVIDMTSSDPMTVKDLTPLCTERGVQLIDAPVSGGVDGAEGGTLTFMIGGDEKVIEKMRDIFQIKNLRRLLITGYIVLQLEGAQILSQGT